MHVDGDGVFERLLDRTRPSAADLLVYSLFGTM
jgi:hypothetical protein